MQQPREGQRQRDMLGSPPTAPAAAQAWPLAPAAAESLELCHTCRTNHALHLGLLGAYYPAACSAAEEQALDAALPAYKAGLEVRYPLLCAACRPAVEQTILRRDRMSRAQAMHGWLQRSRAAAAAAPPVQLVRPASAAVWALRGVLWALSFAAGLVLAASAATELELLSPRASRSAAQGILLSLPVALLWNFWNPLWLHAARARVRVGGDRVRLDGTAWWLRAQAAILTARAASALLVFAESELLAREYVSAAAIRAVQAVLGTAQAILLVLAIRRLRFRAPARVRLVSGAMPAAKPPLPAAPSLSPAPPADPLPALSLSSFSLAERSAPVFGQPSLTLDTLLQPSSGGGEAPAADAMDWSPTTAHHAPSAAAAERDAFQLGPQRFFGPQASSGLEDLFGAALDLRGSSDGDEGSLDAAALAARAEQRRRRERRFVAGIAGAAATAALVALAVAAWQSREQDVTW